MVGFLGFLILGIGGGGLALILGVPPSFIGVYLVGLLALGAIFGFGSSSGGSGSRGSGRGSGSGSGGGKSKVGKAADAASGFLSGLDSSNSSDRRSRYRRNRNTGDIQRSDSSGNTRNVGSFGNQSDSTGNDSETTNDEGFINSGDNSSNMAGRGRPPVEVKEDLKRTEKDLGAEADDAKDEASSEGSEEGELKELKELMEDAKETQKDVVKNIREIKKPIDAFESLFDDNNPSIQDIAKWAHEHGEAFEEIESRINKIEQDLNHLEEAESSKERILQHLEQELEHDEEELMEQEEIAKELDQLTNKLEKDVGLTDNSDTTGMQSRN